MNVKYLAALALTISLVLLPSIVMAEDPEPIINGGVPVFIEPSLPVQISVRFEVIEYSTDILIAFGQRLGLIPMDDPVIAVVINEWVVAVIPEDSKFVGIEPTAVCLAEQYGTDRWYECEQAVITI
jgi:hypothetical protein